MRTGYNSTTAQCGSKRLPALSDADGSVLVELWLQVPLYSILDSALLGHCSLGNGPTLLRLIEGEDVCTCLFIHVV